MVCAPPLPLQALLNSVTAGCDCTSTSVINELPLGCVEDVDLAVGKGQVQLQVTDVGATAHHVRV